MNKFYIDGSSVISLTEFYIREAEERGERITLQGLADSTCIHINAFRNGQEYGLDMAMTMIEAALEQELVTERCELAMDDLVKDFGWKR